MAERLRILLADRIPESGLAPLHDDHFQLIPRFGLSGNELRAELDDADAVIVRSSTTITRESLATTSRLRVIGRAGVGVDNIDLPAATEKGIAVFNAPSGNTISAAELTLALMLAVVRKVPAADRSIRAGEWDRKRFRGSELHGKTLVLIGAGRIGTEVARRARAFGMRVVASDPFLQEERARQLGIEMESLDAALAHADILSLHVPLTDATLGLIDARRLDLLRPSAILINAARGGLVDEDAVVDRLRDGRLAGAAFDVYRDEPLPAGHALLELDNVVLTPHIGAATDEAQHNVAVEVAAAVRDALLEEDYSGAINAPAVGGELMRRIAPLLDLATRLGRLARALGGGGESLEVRYAGQNAEDVLRPVTAAAMVGVLTGIVGRGAVNLVNALLLAEARGVRISRVYLEAIAEFPEHLELRVAGGGLETRVAGCLRGNTPRIIRIDAFPVDVRPRGVLVILRNRDVPGVIGRVGSVLGDAGVNIAEYHQSRLEAGGEALAAVAVDEKLAPDVLGALRRLPDVLAVRQAELD